MGETITVEQYGEGQIVRGEGGRFLPGTRSPKPITHENAREMRDKRYEKAKQQAAQGMIAGVRASRVKADPSVVSTIGADMFDGDEYDAWAVLNAATTLQVMASDIPRPEAVTVLGQNAGMVPRRDTAEADQSPPMQRALTALAHELVETLRDVLHERGESPAVQVIDIEPG